MVRLHEKELQKVKISQWLWLVEELRDGTVLKIPTTIVDKNASSILVKYHHPTCYTREHNFKTWIKVNMFTRKYDGLWGTYHYGQQVNSMYLAKVTRKEEPEFIAMLLTGV